MASKNNPKSVEQLIRENSKARVIKHGAPYTRQMVRSGRIFSEPLRMLTNRDAVEQMVRKYA